MNGIVAVLLVTLVLSTPCRSLASGMAPLIQGQAHVSGSGSERVVYRLDFSTYTGGSVEEWLASKGFKWREAAKNPDELAMAIVDGALTLEAKKQLRGFVYNDSLHIAPFSKIRIEWGITKFPENASYEKQVRNEALMIYVSFGDEKMPSGSIVLPVPDLPPFIGLFLCQGNDKLFTPYTGAYYHQGGRFVCLGHPQPHQPVISEFDLVTAFQTYFEKAEVPYISGLNFGVDTSDAGDGGKASAYVKRIEILK